MVCYNNPLSSAAVLHQALKSTPKLVDLMNKVAAKIPTKWNSVGLELGLEAADLKRIAVEVYTRDCTTCYTAVFDIWRSRNTSPYTWETIISALQSPLVDEPRLAEDIKSELVKYK